MYDKQLIARRFGHALGEYNKLATVQRGIAERLYGLLWAEMSEGAVERVLEIGSGSGFLTCLLAGGFPKSHISAVDLVEQSGRYLPAGVDFKCGDGEFFEVEQQVDMIASSSTVQWFDSLEVFFGRCGERLTDGGVVGISTFGGENFREITRTTSQSLNYPSKQDIEQMLERSGLRLVHSEEWHEQLHFSTPIEVLRHIKATGVNAITPTKWGRTELRYFEDTYMSLYPDITLTFHPIIILARKG